MRQCTKCLWMQADKGCLLKEGNILTLVCRTCYAIYSDNTAILKTFRKAGRNNIGLQRHDGKEWFEPRDNATDTILVLITKDQFKNC